MKRHQGPRVRGLFITGTDTGVGKTIVAAGLAAWCRARGMDVGVMKPIATGGGRGMHHVVSSDARRLAQAAGVGDPHSLINPVCYREPLAPYTAALRSRRPVAWSAVRGAFRELARRHQFLIVEGIGGLLVPLSRRRTVADLIRLLELPVLIVSRVRLGTLNHTLLTAEQARRERLKVLGVVLNAPEPPAVSPDERLAKRTNPAILDTCLSVPLLGTLPYRRALANGMLSPAALTAWVAKSLDPALLNWLQVHGLPD